jgi:hypothetical protein
VLEFTRVQKCVFGYGLLLVGRLSSYREIARGAHESIPWTVKTFDRWGKWQVNDELYAEVSLWCASGPIARRWIVPTCVWKFSD